MGFRLNALDDLNANRKRVIARNPGETSRDILYLFD
jgi:hypothetical protein